MDIDEAILKTSYKANVEDFKNVVEWFIKENKGLSIKVDLYSESIMAGDKINPIVFNLHVRKLLRAYVYALEYYRNEYNKWDQLKKKDYRRQIERI